MTTITYETIIAHLMPKQNTFSLQPNIIMKASDFPLFKDIFDDVFYRIGITNMYMGKNISLQNSVMYCIDSQYNNKDIESIVNTISDNIENIVKELHINIFIFDFKNNNIECVHDGDYMNPWRPSIYLAHCDEWWEPIVVKDLRIFSFSSARANILKHNILNMNVYRYNTKDNITINDNFNEVIILEGFIKNTTTNDSEELFIAPIIPTRGKLDKMKKDELIALCNTLNKIINISKPTKKDLIDIITN
jgi:hypothetical protein